MFSVHAIGTRGTAGDGFLNDNEIMFGIQLDTLVYLWKSEMLAAINAAQGNLPLAERDQIIFVSDIVGDLNGDLVFDVNDIDILNRQVWQREAITSEQAFNWALDISGNGVISRHDVDVLVASAGITYGDVNLDGYVDSVDESIADASMAAGGTSYGWQDGDFTGDGRVTQDDLDILDLYLQ